jgi:hypothetical protein
MAGPFRLPSSAGDPSAAGRIGLALAASALVHGVLLALPLLETRRQGAAPYATDAPITARLAPEPVSLSNAPAVPNPQARRTSGQSKSLADRIENARIESPPIGAARPGAEASTVARAPDPAYYPASDLDVYPRPVAPLEIGRLAGALSGSSTGRIRLVLLIDEYGVVNKVAVVDPGQSGHPENELRAAFVATRFHPARKDGRDVRSRLVLSVDPGPGNRDQ